MFRVRRAICDNVRFELQDRPIPEQHSTFSVKNNDQLFICPCAVFADGLRREENDKA
jgi:hypothetical protein